MEAQSGELVLSLSVRLSSSGFGSDLQTKQPNSLNLGESQKWDPPHTKNTGGVEIIPQRNQFWLCVESVLIRYLSEGEQALFLFVQKGQQGYVLSPRSKAERVEIVYTSV
jgi:hypothetical protein